MKNTFTFLLLCWALATQAQSIEQLKQDMYGIASDATEGRFTGSPGYLKAAKYVARQLRMAGLKTSFQAVPFIWDNYDGSTITIGGRIYAHKGGNFVVLQRSTPVQGEWLLLRAMPDSAGQAALRRQKPAGIILVPDQQQSADWQTTVIRQYRFGYMHYAADYVPQNGALTIILISPALAGKLVNGQKPAVKLMFRLDSINGYNVIATLPGTDRRFKDQTIIAGAHMDHIGRLGSHIYNGANDDGSGCVAVIAAAKAMVRHPAERPLLFVFYCGEELNLLGSRYFMEHPLLPIKNILMNINLEQVGSKHRSFSGIWAIGDKQFKDQFLNSGKIFAQQDLKFSPTDSLVDVLSNTDSYSFMKKDVPSLLLGSGGFPEHHSTLDKINQIDFEHLRKTTILLITLIYNLGNGAAIRR